MALVSLSVKRHLGEEFPVVPPSPPQSPMFCSSPIHLLGGLQSTSENQPKKRRKQEHPLFLTDSQPVAADGTFESSSDEMEKSQTVKESKTMQSNDAGCDYRSEDVLRNVHHYGHHGAKDDSNKRLRNDRVGVDERKDLVANAGFDFEGKQPANHMTPGSHVVATCASNVPLMLLSQVASDVVGRMTSPLKSQPEMMTYLKQEEFVGDGRAPSDGELPSGGDQPADGAAAEVCPDCKKVFKRKIYLQRHIAREHWSLAKIFKCEKCAYETKHQSNLLVHRRTHTGERPYHCGACGQRYTQGHLLKAHIRSRHGADMRFYNMDKRTDGMRCRRLLGAKLIGGGKEDRIRFLLQAAEAVRHRPSPPSPPRPLFNPMMPPSLNQYMNVLSCLPSGLRPVLWPSLSGGLLGTSGGFPSSGPLQNGMPSHAQLLSSLAAPLSSLTGGKISSASSSLSSKASESLLSSMLALPSGAAPLQAIKLENFSDSRISSSSSSSKVLSSSPDRSGRQGVFPIVAELPTMPEDLTTTRRTGEVAAEKTPSRDREGFNICPLSAVLSVGHDDQISATDLTSQDASRNRDAVKSRNGDESRPFPDDSMIAFPRNHQKLEPTRASSRQPVMMSWSDGRSSVRSEPVSETDPSRRMSLDAKDAYPGQVHMTSAQWSQFLTDQLQLGGGGGGTEQSASDSCVGLKSPAKTALAESAARPAVESGSGKTAPSTCHSEFTEPDVVSCKEACCPYLKKLKDLRRNVYRMLCVFTPYLGVANINDYEADSIDEFLHEVIYSKLDDCE